MNAVFYRVYGLDGAFQSKNAFDNNDLAIGRTNANWVPPPSTVADIKRYLGIAEMLVDDVKLELYSADSAAPLDDELILSVSSGVGPGTSVEEALKLKIVPKRPTPTVQTMAQPISSPRKRSFNLCSDMCLQGPRISFSPEAEIARLSIITFREEESRDGHQPKLRALRGSLHSPLCCVFLCVSSDSILTSWKTRVQHEG